MNVNNIFRGAIDGLKEHSGTILSGIAVVGVFVSTYFSGKAAVMVDHELDPDMDFKEKAKLYGKAYWKTGVAVIATSACIIGSDRRHVGKEAAAAGAIALWKKRSMDQNRILVDEVGPERLHEINEERKEKEEREDIKRSASMSSKLLVYCPYSEQYFYTTRETIAWVMLEVNRMLVNGRDVKLNTLNKMLGGEPKEEVKNLGWFIEDEDQYDEWCDFFGGPWIEIEPDVIEHGKREALCLFYTVEPRKDSFCNKLYKEET